MSAAAEPLYNPNITYSFCNSAPVLASGQISLTSNGILTLSNITNTVTNSFSINAMNKYGNYNNIPISLNILIVNPTPVWALPTGQIPVTGGNSFVNIGAAGSFGNIMTLSGNYVSTFPGNATINLAQYVSTASNQNITFSIPNASTVSSTFACSVTSAGIFTYSSIYSIPTGAFSVIATNQYGMTAPLSVIMNIYVTALSAFNITTFLTGPVVLGNTPWSVNVANMYSFNGTLTYVYALMQLDSTGGFGARSGYPAYVGLDSRASFNTTTGLLTVYPAYRNTKYNFTVVYSGYDGLGNYISGGNVFILITETNSAGQTPLTPATVPSLATANGTPTFTFTDANNMSFNWVISTLNCTGISSASASAINGTATYNAGTFSNGNYTVNGTCTTNTQITYNLTLINSPSGYASSTNVVSVTATATGSLPASPTPSASAGTPSYSSYNGSTYTVSWIFTCTNCTGTPSVVTSGFSGFYSGSTLTVTGTAAPLSTPTVQLSLQNTAAGSTPSSATPSFTANTAAPAAPLVAPTPSASAGTPTYASYNGSSYPMTWIFTCTNCTNGGVTTNGFSSSFSGSTITVTGNISPSTTPSISLYLQNVISGYATTTSTPSFTASSASPTAVAPSLNGTMPNLQGNTTNGGTTFNGNVSQYFNNVTSYSCSPTTNITIDNSGNLVINHTQNETDYYMVTITGTNPVGSVQQQFWVYNFNQAPICTSSASPTTVNTMKLNNPPSVATGVVTFYPANDGAEAFCYVPPYIQYPSAITYSISSNSANSQAAIITPGTSWQGYNNTTYLWTLGLLPTNTGTTTINITCTNSVGSTSHTYVFTWN